MERPELLEKLMWNGELNQFWWIDQESNKDLTKPIDRLGDRMFDCKSIVVINGLQHDFTNEELEKLYEVSDNKRKYNDERYYDRIGTKKTIITKTPSENLQYMKPWMVKFEWAEWIKGFETVDEVIEYVMNK